ncbi:hypothetical protein PIB30_021511 [Stylosanthes scabra]|uniref:Uncharacterized protein n=1 Tax=Stylosanthes scabra TaxID=79078 RepID=A0ABU6Q8V1_9FABA|nr:hypothetical protein [Stylosanthes scabra]
MRGKGIGAGLANERGKQLQNKKVRERSRTSERERVACSGGLERRRRASGGSRGDRRQLLGEQQQCRASSRIGEIKKQKMQGGAPEKKEVARRRCFFRQQRRAPRIEKQADHLGWRTGDSKQKRSYKITKAI